MARKVIAPPPEPPVIRELNPTIDATCITSGLWMGSKPSPEINYRDLGFHYLVFCASEYHPRPSHFEDVKVSRLDLEDGPATVVPSEIRRIRHTTKRIIAGIRSGEKALITCLDGMNRSGLVTAMILNILQGISGRQAVHHIQSRRFLDGKTPFWNNPSFENYLCTLGSRVIPRKGETLWSAEYYFQQW